MKGFALFFQILSVLHPRILGPTLSCCFSHKRFLLLWFGRQWTEDFTIGPNLKTDARLCASGKLQATHAFLTTIGEWHTWTPHQAFSQKHQQQVCPSDSKKTWRSIGHATMSAFFLWSLDNPQPTQNQFKREGKLIHIWPVQGPPK